MSNPNKAIKPKASEGTEPAKEGVDPETFRTNPEEAKAATEAHTSQFFEDLARCRLSDDDTAGLGAGREILTRVPVERPSRKQYVRCHHEPLMTDAMATYIDDDDGETYLVPEHMRGVFGDDVKPTHLQLAMIHRTRTPFIWSSTIPTADAGRGRSWHESALTAKKIAEKTWIKVLSERAIGGYRLIPAEGVLPEPAWLTDKTFQDYLEIAFRDALSRQWITRWSASTSGASDRDRVQRNLGGRFRVQNAARRTAAIYRLHVRPRDTRRPGASYLGRRTSPPSRRAIRRRTFLSVGRL